MVGVCINLLLGKSNEILVVGIHVGQLTVNQHHDLILAGGLLLPDVGGDDPLSLLPKSGVSVHLQEKLSVRIETLSYTTLKFSTMNENFMVAI